MYPVILIKPKTRFNFLSKRIKNDINKTVTNMTYMS